MTNSWRVCSGWIMLIVILPPWYLTHAPMPQGSPKRRTLKRTTHLSVHLQTYYEFRTLYLEHQSSATWPLHLDHFSRRIKIRAPWGLHLQVLHLYIWITTPLAVRPKDSTKKQCPALSPICISGLCFVSGGLWGAAATIVLNAKDVFKAKACTPWSLTPGLQALKEKVM